MQPKRRRAAATGAWPPPDIQVKLGTRFWDLDQYAERLRVSRCLAEARINEVLVGTTERKAGQLEKIAKSMACGRVLGIDQQGVAERTSYCGIVTLCGCCRDLDTQKRAAALLESAKQPPGLCLTHLVLTLEKARTGEESAVAMEFCSSMRPRLSRALQRLARELHITTPYLLGMHLAPHIDSEPLTPHFHLVFLTPAGTRHVHATRRIETIWNAATEKFFGYQALVKRALVQKRVTAEVANDKVEISLERAENLLAYVQRINKPDDSPELIRTRETLMRSSDFSRNFWASTSRDGGRKTAPAPSFNPLALAKPQIVVFPLSGGLYFASAADYEAVQGKIEQETREAVYGAHNLRAPFPMARRPKSPLNRYAAPCDFQLDQTREIAKVLADPNSSSLELCRAMKEFFWLTTDGEWRYAGRIRWQVERNYARQPDRYWPELENLNDYQPPSPDSPDPLTVHRLGWTNSLEENLRKLGHRSPAVTPIYFFDYYQQFHFLPRLLSEQPIWPHSNKYLTMNHLLELARYAPVKLSPYDHLATSLEQLGELREYAAYYSQKVGEKAWTANQMTNAIRKDRGLRPSGRPAKK